MRVRTLVLEIGVSQLRCSLCASGVATPGPILMGPGPGEFLSALVNHVRSTYLNPVA